MGKKYFIPKNKNAFVPNVKNKKEWKIAAIGAGAGALFGGIVAPPAGALL